MSENLYKEITASDNLMSRRSKERYNNLPREKKEKLM